MQKIVIYHSPPSSGLTTRAIRRLQVAGNRAVFATAYPDAARRILDATDAQHCIRVISHPEALTIELRISIPLVIDDAHMLSNQELSTLIAGMQDVTLLCHSSPTASDLLGALGKEHGVLAEEWRRY